MLVSISKFSNSSCIITKGHLNIFILNKITTVENLLDYQTLYINYIKTNNKNIVMRTKTI